MPKVGKKHFSYTPAGKNRAKAYAKKVGARLQEIGTVGALATQRKRERDPSDFLSQGKRSTKRQSNVGFETKNQRASNTLSLRQRQDTGKLGGGATSVLVKRKIGITAGTEMNREDKLSEISAAQAKDIQTKHSKAPGRRGLLGLKAPDAAKTEIHGRNVSNANSRIAARDDARGRAKYDAQKDAELKSGQKHSERQRAKAISLLRAGFGKHPDSAKKGFQNSPLAVKRYIPNTSLSKKQATAIRRSQDLQAREPKPTSKLAAGTEWDWTHKLVEHLIVEKDWIQGAVNPAHKGYCTPMTKDTCTPKRKALAKRFKKAGRKEKRSGGTGWEGKV